MMCLVSKDLLLSGLRWESLSGHPAGEGHVKTGPRGAALLLGLPGHNHFEEAGPPPWR